MHRQYSRRSAGRGQRPTRQWVPLQGAVLTAASTTLSAKLLEFQAPTVTIGTALTAAPPEDQTILRIVSEFTVQVTATTVANRICLGLLMADVAWTPGSTSVADLDKRFLWYKSFSLPTATASAGVAGWAWESGLLAITATANQLVQVDLQYTQLDITPKVKLEDGKALTLVAYVDASSGLTSYSVALRTMRVLMQRSGRR